MCCMCEKFFNFLIYKYFFFFPRISLKKNTAHTAHKCGFLAKNGLKSYNLVTKSNFPEIDFFNFFHEKFYFTAHTALFAHFTAHKISLFISENSSPNTHLSATKDLFFVNLFRYICSETCLLNHPEHINDA